jgi:hypothetical protein
MQRILFTVLALLLLTAPITVAARDDIPGNCEVDGAEQANWIPRYVTATGEIQLVDWTTREVVRVLDTEIDTDDFAVYLWSDDCRYLAGRIGPFEDTTLVVWDTVAGERVDSIDNLYLYAVRFSPDSSQALVETRTGAFLWRYREGQQVRLTDDFKCFGRSFRQIDWDVANNLFLGIEQDFSCRHAPGPLRVHDLTTGELLDTVPGAQFRWLKQGETILLVGPLDNPFTIFYDVRSRTQVDLGINGGVTNYVELFDDRYLVIARNGVHLYDLQANTHIVMELSQPYSEWDIDAVSIADGVIEARYKGTPFTWNLFTGARVS